MVRADFLPAFLSPFGVPGSGGPCSDSLCGVAAGAGAWPQPCLCSAAVLQTGAGPEPQAQRQRCCCRRMCSPVPALLPSPSLSAGSARGVALQGQRHQPLPVPLPRPREPPCLSANPVQIPGHCCQPGPQEMPGCLLRPQLCAMGMCDLFCVVPQFPCARAVLPAWAGMGAGSGDHHVPLAPYACPSLDTLQQVRLFT